ncbi:RabGAP/TBC domain-containing protein [Heterostelium album PN500]|uniref:RabGAP/TBC domain-containing protein n=1 Tax=Heterostelium pallidum (strain ATCC 26659 / Pp 5 / PN500) TaxID=670386 RepID=D3BHG9_HETP5|nr:RabGAP/TBC domain-containing protein [Heterostelium album PN500]EFA79146.1 RabGAP/TBC domain-containing protein [Heterostelium album PN500]|eukprot:XP_020431268.1 RabGAP/TBC domain-containing protein [Heterostelium album PN500]
MIEINNSNRTSDAVDNVAAVNNVSEYDRCVDDSTLSCNHVDVTNTSSTTSNLNDSHDSNISSSSSSNSSSSSIGTTTALEQQMVNKIKIEDSVFKEEDLAQLCTISEPVDPHSTNSNNTATTATPINDDINDNNKSSSSSTCSENEQPPQQLTYLTNVQIFQRSPIFAKLKPPAMKEHVNTFPKLEKITPLEMEWMEQVMVWNTAQRDCTRLCRLGIPARLRGFIWRLCSGAVELEKKNIGVYHYFLTKQSDEYEYKISKDIARTFPKVEQFSKEQGQIALFNILKAYSVMDPEIGYTQGMSFIAAVLLSVMDEILFSHLKEIGVTPVLFASEWISTLFTYNFNLEISVRFWDVFFVSGRYYLHRLVLAILTIYERQLLQYDFEGAVEFLKKVGTIINPDHAISVADNIQITVSKIEELEEEYDHPDCGPSDYF